MHKYKTRMTNDSGFRPHEFTVEAEDRDHATRLIRAEAKKRARKWRAMQSGTVITGVEMARSELGVWPVWCKVDMSVTFTIPGAADCALQTTDGGFYNIHQSKTWRCGKGSRVRITADVEVAREIRDEAIERTGPFWDQPSSWARACAKAATAIDAAIAAFENGGNTR